MYYVSILTNIRDSSKDNNIDDHFLAPRGPFLLAWLHFNSGMNK